MGAGGCFQQKPAISQKRCKVGPRLLLITNRKSHTRFRLMPNRRPWMTLNGHYALFSNARIFGANRENLNEDRPLQSAANLAQ